MVMKIYSVNLDEEIVAKAKDKWEREHYGKKLSPLINQLLKEWIKKREKLKEVN